MTTCSMVQETAEWWSGLTALVTFSGLVVVALVAVVAWARSRWTS